jgi:hypothetical protein
MGKSRHSKYNNRLMDREYSDGNDHREEHKNKRKERRFERALKICDINNLVEEEELEFVDIPNENLLDDNFMKYGSR